MAPTTGMGHALAGVSWFPAGFFDDISLIISSFVGSRFRFELFDLERSEDLSFLVLSSLFDLSSFFVHSGRLS